MSLEFNGSSDYLENTNAVVTALPITMACWFYAGSDTTDEVIMAVGDTDGVPRVQLQTAGTQGGDPIGWGCTGATTSATPRTTTGYTAGVWHHACGRSASATSHRVWLDGGGGATAITNVGTWSGPIRTNVGCRWNSGSRGAFFNGRLAHAAIWSVALTDAEVAVLATGVSPLLVRPTSLVSYWPLLGRHSTEIPYRGSHDLTISGATYSERDPPVRWPARKNRIVVPGGVAGVTGAASLAQAGHVLTAAGTVAARGAAGLTQAAQTLSAKGAAAVAGTTSVAQAGHAVASSAAVAVVGIAALAPASHTLAAAGGRPATAANRVEFPLPACTRVGFPLPACTRRVF